MVFIKVKNGRIHLTEKYYNNNNYKIGLDSIFLKNLNLLNIETDCKIQILDKCIEIKRGEYSITELNKLFEPIVLTYVNKKIEIKSPCYYNLDENLKKYLGFKDIEFNFSLVSSNPIVYYPNSNENYINIEQDCRFRLGRNGQIPQGTIFIGIYSIGEIENLFNSFGAKFVANFPKINLEINKNVLKITASIGLCFDEYLSNCLGFDFIKYLFPINKTWPKGKEIVLGVEYTHPDIAYTVIGTKNVMTYTQGFIKNIKGIISTKNSKTELKGNYSIEHLNSLFSSIMKLENNDNYIKITKKDYFSFDQDLNLSLGIVDMNYLYKHIGEILNNNINKRLLDVHCNIIEKSFSSVNDVNHIEEDLLYTFYYDDVNPYIKTNPIMYIPVKGHFQTIEIHIIDQNGKKYYFEDDDFIVYLDLIKE